MADTVVASGNVDIGLISNSIDMQSQLHHQPLIHTTYKNDQNNPEKQIISASCTDLSTVAINPNINCDTCSTTNFSSTKFRCERCDNFETSSRSTLLLHVVQCLSSPTKLKSEETDAENLSLTGASLSNVDQIRHTGGSVSANPPKEGVSNNASATSGSSSNGSARKVFECDVCNMKFSNGANMRRHKMRHTGVKPYECRVCQKRFFRKDHLAEHFTTHTKTLPYHCPICNRGFQRQIAMRAHFQNEHVGQHDLVKTCPLCSYRAGSMKSLRIHFHNRHGIDLDNPGPGGSSSLLLALETQASQVAVAAVASFMPNLNPVASTSVNVNLSNNQSDSGDSLRSTENATPPMHLLTPHVEISMPDNSAEMFNENSIRGSSDAETRVNNANVGSSPAPTRVANICPSPGNIQDESIDCHAKSDAAKAVSALQMASSPKNNQYDNHILPSISLIPIKQEPLVEDSPREPIKNGQSATDSAKKLRSDNESIYTTTENSKLSSLIKVSPLKSLLREDLKRRICAKANNRIIRNAAILENNNVSQSNLLRNNNSVSCNTKAVCNGFITLSGQETESSMLNRKQILTCLFCGIEFPDETLYFLHKGCHCESNPWKCNICGEQCNNVYEFNSHLLSKSHQ